MSEQTTFTLELTFSGLCLFVRDAVRNTLYVLMPKGVASEDEGEGPPALAVYGDHRYLKPGKGLIVEAKTEPKLLIRPNRAYLTLNGTGFLELGTLSSAGLVDMGSLTGGRSIVPGVFGADPDDLLNGRVDLGSGSSPHPMPGACWQVDGAQAQHTNQVAWTMEMEGEELHLEFNPLEGGAAQETLTLYPGTSDDGRRSIALLVCNTPFGELPPLPDDPGAPSNSPAYEFGAFYRLYGYSRFVGLPLPSSCTDTEGGSPFTCLAGLG